MKEKMISRLKNRKGGKSERWGLGGGGEKRKMVVRRGLVIRRNKRGKAANEAVVGLVFSRGHVHNKEPP